MNKFDELYNKIISEGRHTLVYYIAIKEDGTKVGEDDDLFQLEQFLLMGPYTNIFPGDSIKIYKVDDVLMKKSKLIEIYHYNSDKKWEVETINV